MSALGRLVASVVLDTAEFTVGTDKAKHLAASAATSINRSMSDLESSVKTKLGGIAAAFAAGFGVAALKKAFDDVIESAARLNDIAKVTGSSVETLSKISQGAKLAGKDMGDVSPAIQKMIAGLKGLEPETQAAGQALQYLGISTTDANGKLKSGGELYLEVAKAMGGLEEGAGKVRISQALMGKAGAEQIPIMEKLESAGDLVAKVTAQQAEQAERYKENLIRLSAAKGALTKTIAMELLPVADAFVRTLLKMQTESTGVKDKVGELARDGSIRSFAEGAVSALGFVMNAGDSVKRVFEIAGEAIALTLAKATNNAVAAGKALFAIATGNMFGAGTAMVEADAKNAAMSQQAAIRFREILEKPLAGDNFVANFREQLNRAEPALKSGKKSADDFKGALGVAAQAAVVLMDAHVRAYDQHIADLAKSVAKAIAEGIEARRKALDAIRDETAAQEFANETYGMTKREIADLIVVRLEEQAAILRASGDMETQLKQLQEEIDLRKKLASALARGEGIAEMAKSMREQQQLWLDISHVAGSFFADLVLNGKDAFDRLKQYLKSFAADLIAIFAQKWILNMVGQGSLAGSVGQGTLAGALANGSLGSMLGGSLASGAASLGFGSASQFIGGATGAIAGPALPGSALAAGQSLAGVGSMIASAMPYIAAAVIAYQLFAKPGGGPKEGGSYYGQYTSFGDYLGQGRVPGTDNGRFFTPSGSDSQVAAIGAGAASQYYASARALGLNAGAFSFGLGFDTDPRGTAPNRVSSGLVDASGRTIYGARDRDIGRDSEAITPALQLEASRMVAAAIKASELPAYLKRVFDGLTVETATQQQIDDAMNTATALKSIFDVVSRNPLEDVATQIEASQNQYDTALKANAKAIRDAIDQFDGTAASTQKLSAATTQYYNAQLQLMAAIAQVSQQINAMFDSTFQNIKLAGLDKQGKYDFYQSDAEEARRLLATATDPEVIRQLSARINQDINAAFGLLSPEEQKARSAEFITQGKQAQKEANDRLEKIQKDAADATTKTLKEIKELLGMNAEDFKQAGADIKAGGAAILEAADQGVTVRIVDARGNAIVNGG